MTKSGITRFSIKNLFSHKTEEHRKGTILCFTKFLFCRNFLDKMGGAGEREVVSQFSVKSFSLTVAEKVVEEPFNVSLVSGSEMFLLRMLMPRFSVRNFCLTVPKTSVEKSFFVSEVFWYRKKLGIREGEAITSFRHFLFHSTKFFRRGTMLLSTKYRVTIIFRPTSGISGVSKESLLCHSTEKLRRATFLCIHKFCGIEKSHG